MRKIAALVLALLLTLGLAVPALAANARGAQGVVTDSLGRPVSGAEVEVYRLGQGLTAVLTTSESGAFRIDAKLDAGALWQLRVSAKGYHTVDTGWQDLARSPYQAVRMERLDGTLRVTALDQNGEGLLARMLVIGAGGHVVIDTLDGDGLLELDGLRAGEYRLLVQSGTTVPWSSTVSVTAGSVASVTALLQPAAIAVSGEVRDGRTGLPVPGARVELLRDDQTSLTEARADDEGRFRIGLGAGESGPVKVQAWAEGYQAVTSAAVTLKGGEEQDFSGKDALVLQPSVTAVAGTVLNHDGKPRPNTPVMLEAKGFGWVGTVTADARGFFRFADVSTDPAVQYRAFVAVESEIADTGWISVAGGNADQIVLQTVARGTETAAYGEMEGTVLSASGAPVAGARVELYRRARLEKTLITDATGRFLATELPGTKSTWQTFEPYTVRISKDGYLTTSQFVTGGQDALTVHVGANTRPVIRATLRAAKTELRGRIIGNKGEAVANAEVYLMTGPYTRAVEMVRTDARGWYDFKDVPLMPGTRFVLQGKAAGYHAFAGMEVSPSAVERQTLPTLRLTARNALFTGLVLGPDGQPAAGASVQALGPAGTSLGEAQADANGFYRLTAAVPAAGRGVTLTAGLKGFTPGALELADQVEPGATLGRDLVVVPATARLSGRVLGAGDTPLGGAKVELLKEGYGVVATDATNLDGSYRFEDVSVTGSGWFWLRVRPAEGLFAGSLRHQTELVPLLQLPPGQEIVTDLLVK